MSKIGRRAIELPSGVTVEVKGGSVTVKGGLGSMDLDVPAVLTIEVGDKSVCVKNESGSPDNNALHGLTRCLLANAVTGVSKGFEKVLEIVGVGYNAKAEGKKVTLRIGFCHPVSMDMPAGIEIETPEPIKIVVKGCDKQLVGEMAARIRRIRPPEPYKGKGIRYADEQVRRKAGKTFVAAG